VTTATNSEHQDDTKEDTIKGMATQADLLTRSARFVRRFLGKSETAGCAPEQMLSPLEEPFRSALLSMYRNEAQEGLDQGLHPIDPSLRIPTSQGMWLYENCRTRRLRSILEIGTCYGYSALFILAAISKNAVGHLTSIDPFERTWWHGIALRSIEKAGAGQYFRYIEDRSDRAGIDLAREGAKFDLIFIDGNHRFDDVLTDFYLFAQLCEKGGQVVFDDMWMPSIRTVVSFVRANRADFREAPNADHNIAVFEKVDEDPRDWNHFRPFSIVG
jgi:predicted O-methyltransferase YrrM